MADFVHGDQGDQKLAHEHIVQDHAVVDHEKDLEAGVLNGGRNESSDAGLETAEVIKAREIQQHVTILGKLRAGEEWLDAKMGIETQGIDRIHEEDKHPPGLMNVFWLWWSLTCHVGTVPLGVLGPEFGLSFNQSMSAVVVGTVLGALCTAYTGTLGPKMGLRAIATSRYSFGFYGAYICSFLNVVIGGGFSVVNIVVVGQILSAVSDYKMTIAVGCIIIAIIGYVISIFGFRLIHTYEKYSWIGTFIILLILVGQTGGKVQVSAPPLGTGISQVGEWLSFMTICFSSASGWCSIASDYYCNYPANTKSWKIFALTFWGITIPTIFATTVGVILGNAALTVTGVDADGNDIYLNPNLSEAYEDHLLGGLLRESFHPLGFSKFLLVLLVFSVLGNNIAVNYSSGLSMQLLGHYFHAIPRFIWSFINALVIALIAIAGREHLSTIVSNFVSLLGYWTVSFTIILLVEDQWFRKHSKVLLDNPSPGMAFGYDLLAWDFPKLLPVGAAAVIALLCGYLGGGVPGMAQVWYIGPIALKFGPYGGDVGVFLSFAFTLFVYPPLRWLEIKKFGR